MCYSCHTESAAGRKSDVHTNLSPFTHTSFQIALAHGAHIFTFSEPALSFASQVLGVGSEIVPVPSFHIQSLAPRRQTGIGLETVLLSELRSQSLPLPIFNSSISFLQPKIRSETPDQLVSQPKNVRIFKLNSSPVEKGHTHVGVNQAWWQHRGTQAEISEWQRLCWTERKCQSSPIWNNHCVFQCRLLEFDLSKPSAPFLHLLLCRVW